MNLAFLCNLIGFASGFSSVHAKLQVLPLYRSSIGWLNAGTEQREVKPVARGLSTVHNPSGLLCLCLFNILTLAGLSSTRLKGIYNYLVTFSGHGHLHEIFTGAERASHIRFSNLEASISRAAFSSRVYLYRGAREERTSHEEAIRTILSPTWGTDPHILT